MKCQDVMDQDHRRTQLARKMGAEVVKELAVEKGLDQRQGVGRVSVKEYDTAGAKACGNQRLGVIHWK